jgi:hypothetical protein
LLNVSALKILVASVLCTQTLAVENGPEQFGSVRIFPENAYVSVLRRDWFAGTRPGFTIYPSSMERMLITLTPGGVRGWLTLSEPIYASFDHWDFQEEVHREPVRKLRPEEIFNFPVGYQF